MTQSNLSKEMPSAKRTPYIPTFNGAATAAQMATAAASVGLAAPDLNAPFRYLDVGCGRGITLLTMAAAYPDSEFIGIDFNPDHIEEARRRADRLDLANATFLCAAFDDPALTTIEPVDFAVAFGIFSWVMQEQQREVCELLDKVLKSDGLVAVSYNTLAGGAQALPLRAILQKWVAADDRPPAVAKAEAIRRLIDLKDLNPPYFSANPVAGHLIDVWADSDINYVIHEILGDSWNLFDLSDIAALFQRCGFEFVGDRTALLTDPRLLSADFDPVIAEDMASLATGRMFRTDVFSRNKPKEYAQPLFPEVARFGPAWPANSSSIRAQAEQPSLEGRVLAATLTRPLSWSELAAEPALQAAPQRTIAAALRKAMTTWTMTRYDGPIAEADARSQRFRLANAFSEEMLSAPDLRMMDPALPSRLLGGAVRVPPIVAHLLLAGHRGLDIARWPAAALDSLGEGFNQDPKTLEDACDLVAEDWVPFLIKAGVLQQC